MKKQWFSILLCLCMMASMVSGAFAQEEEALSADDRLPLGIPTNLAWEADSTATATWGRVDGADCYRIEVLVMETGSTFTATTEARVDVQQEINAIVGDSTRNEVYVRFKVQAGILQEDGSVTYGEWSSASDEKVYFLTNVEQLDTPANIGWQTGTQEATWTGDIRTDGYRMELEFESNGETFSYLLSAVQHSGGDTGNIVTSMKLQLLSAYCTLGLNPKTVTVRYRACAFSNSSLYRDSAYSDWSTAMTYQNDGPTVLNTPLDIGWQTGTQEATWTGDIRADGYRMELEFESNGETFSYLLSTVQYSGRDTGNIVTSMELQLLSAYCTLGLNPKTVTVRYRACAFSNSPIYADSAYSDWSTAMTYQNDGPTVLNTPTDIGWQTGTQEATWTGDIRADGYRMALEFESNGETVPYFLSTVPHSGRDTGNIVTSLKQDLFAAYRNLGLDPEPVVIRYKVCAFSNSSKYTDSAYTDWSDWTLYNPNNLTLVEELVLSPDTPMLACGRTLSLGKTISPADAHYTKIIWTSSDETIACIDDNGVITGVKPGCVTISARVGNATSSVVVNVYQLNSNITDKQSQETVKDTTSDIIDSLINGGDATGTDITDIKDAQNKIEDAVDNQYGLNADLTQEEKNESDYVDLMDTLPNEVWGYSFMTGFNVEIELYYRGRGNSYEHIGNITEFDGEVEFVLTAPDAFNNIPEGKTRVFKLVRVHDGISEVIEVEVFAGGRFETKSDRFSDFILLYSDIGDSTGDDTLDDTPDDTETTETAPATPAPGSEIPTTGDSRPLGLMVALLALSILGLGTVLILGKKRG